MAAGKKWSFKETSMAFVLYLLLPEKEFSRKGAEVQRLARALGRTPNAVALKIWNIADHDANRIREGKSGLAHGSRFDSEVWERYQAEGDEYLEQSLQWLLEVTEPKTQETLEIESPGTPEGKERWAVTVQRINQQYFRNSLLKNYCGACCITGITTDPLLVASHIKPWSESDPIEERLSPSNGLLLNALHDRAFDKGLITVDKAHRIRVSRLVAHTEANDQWIWRYDGIPITEPRSFPPDPAFLEYHNDVIFKAS